MGTILSYIEVQDGHAKRSSLEVLSHCRRIADEHGDELAAVVLSATEADVTSRVASQAARHGAATIYTITHPAFERHLNVPVLAALAEVAAKVDPDIIAFPSSESVKEILGALAIRLNGASLPDVSEFDRSEGGVEAHRPVLASRFLARARAEGRPVLVSVRAGSYSAAESPVEARVEEVPFEFDQGSARQTLREVVTATEGTVDLSEARVVVAAGRGVRDERGKQLIEELARTLGAAIGSSRAVVESGHFPASSQVGQTGKVVSPDLYIAVGISGAIQHVAGMSNSRIIVAINKDPDAPIFQSATFGIAGDLYEVLPKLIEALKQR
ncbi:MAG: electron transfer flavoprotein subunit alpha/FixB family protein [Rhodothermales bacterium]